MSSLPLSSRLPFPQRRRSFTLRLRGFGRGKARLDFGEGRSACSRTVRVVATTPAGSVGLSLGLCYGLDICLGGRGGGGRGHSGVVPLVHRRLIPTPRFHRCGLDLGGLGELFARRWTPHASCSRFSGRPRWSFFTPGRARRTSRTWRTFVAVQSCCQSCTLRGFSGQKYPPPHPPPHLYPGPCSPSHPSLV